MTQTKVLDYYKLLGVSPHASDEEIRKAFRQKIIKVHPDHNDAPDANTKTQELTEAYEILKDPITRSDYDKFLNTHQQAAEYENSRFRYAQEAARRKAEEQSDWNVEDILSSVVDAFVQTGSDVVFGSTDDVSIFDYIRSGFIGVLLIIALVLSFTGVGTLPGIAIFWLVYLGIRKGDAFIGFGRFITSTLVMSVVLVILIVIFLSGL